MLQNLEELKNKYNMSIQGMIHIGAHRGQEYSIYHQLGIKNLMFFEPIPKLFKEMKRKAQGVLVNKALGNYNGKGTLYVANNEGASSSLLEPLLHKVIRPEITFERTIEVDVVRLDDELQDKEKYNFITIDVQGYELEVFKGALETLKGIDYIIAEINKIELYRDGARINELDDFLSDYYKVEVKMADPAWGDALYIRKEVINTVKPTFNGMIALYCLNPYKDFDYNTFVDKHKVKAFVKDTVKVSKELAYFTTPEEIDNFNYSSLPEKFIIKGTHGCGWNIFSPDLELMKEWLNIKYNVEEEKQYAQVQPGVLIEEYLDVKENNYKFHVINGTVEFIQYMKGSETRYESFLSSEWNKLPMTGLHEPICEEIPKPNSFEEMLKIVQELVVKINCPKYVRIDIYEVNGEVYFGEYTFTPTGGRASLYPYEYDKKYGELI